MKLSYEERKDIALAIENFFAWLDYLMGSPFRDSSIGEYPTFMWWDRAKVLHREAITRIDLQLARSCGVDWVGFLARPKGERYELWRYRRCPEGYEP